MINLKRTTKDFINFIVVNENKFVEIKLEE